jgi:ferric-dicitrate binding protein FerR (iron transport regulator)
VLGKLWGNGKGKFRTNGKYSSATVRGTIWLVEDRCEGTNTKVRRGVVAVRDFKRKRTVSVKAGHSYLARAASKKR